MSAHDDLIAPALDAAELALAAEFGRAPCAREDARTVLLAALPYLQEAIRMDVGRTIRAMADRGRYDEVSGSRALATVASMLGVGRAA